VNVCFLYFSDKSFNWCIFEYIVFRESDHQLVWRVILVTLFFTHMFNAIIYVKLLFY